MKLNIVIALPCEAKLIIKALSLKKDLNQKAFEIYHNHDDSVCLIVSGIGKVNAAAATSFIHCYKTCEHEGFLNIGIAGGNHNIGQAFLIEKIQDVSTQKCMYPKINLFSKATSEALKSYDTPVAQYPKNYLVDMEAASFYQTALKFTSQEFIQVIKIVSDNNEESRLAINKELATQLIEKNIVEIQSNVETILKFLDAEEAFNQQPKLLEEILQTLHFSSQQQIQLHRLLQRAEIFLKDSEINELKQAAKSSKEFIKQLNKKLEDCV